MTTGVTENPRSFRGPFIITGLSGAGKSVLSRSLEDLGYDCVDNIPLDLVEQLFSRSTAADRLAVVLDVRTRGLAEGFPSMHERLLQQHPNLELFFVEASNRVLERRFSVARRPHPLRDRPIDQAISDERNDLAPVRRLAGFVVDTSELSPHDLRRQVLTLVGYPEPQELMEVEVQSFSYLRGVPTSASLVFDVRFLPNPYYEPRLRPLSGADQLVIEWLDSQESVQPAVQRITELVQYLIPKYGEELKTHLTVAVGCTGGRHRSVYVAERIADELRPVLQSVTVHHRDRDNWG